MTDPNLIDPQVIGRQLRRPSGALGLKVAEKMNQSNHELLQLALAELDLDGAGSLLEVGPGNGAHVPALLARHPGLHYLGLDHAPDMVAEARRYASNRASFRHGDLLDFTAEVSFERILTLNTAYFWQPLAPALARLQAALAPGGRLVLGVRSRRCMEKMAQFQQGFTLFEGPELEAALEGAGFSRVRLQKRREESITIQGQLMEKEALLLIAHKEAP
ncbi:class I SAM-dependent methyltransferase [Gallaecimonas sp. GXIMD4217]|uniref:class I SAM-dependent methyltransferase n=1 Tax=Gallaecimonas sp. GXIMD4217 TaxID=3131927 RepID=UPI00311AE4A9